MRSGSRRFEGECSTEVEPTSGNCPPPVWVRLQPDVSEARKCSTEAEPETEGSHRQGNRAVLRLVPAAPPDFRRSLRASSPAADDRCGRRTRAAPRRAASPVVPARCCYAEPLRVRAFSSFVTRASCCGSGRAGTNAGASVAPFDPALLDQSEQFLAALAQEGRRQSFDRVQLLAVARQALGHLAQ